jgi:hypothetical protein
MLLWRSSEFGVNDTVQGFGSGILGLDWWAGQRVAVQVAEAPGSKSASHLASTAGGRSLSLKAQHHSVALAAIRSPKPSYANKSPARERLQSIKRALTRTSSRLQPSMEGPVAARRPTRAMYLVAHSRSVAVHCRVRIVLHMIAETGKFCSAQVVRSCRWILPLAFDACSADVFSSLAFLSHHPQGDTPAWRA